MCCEHVVGEGVGEQVRTDDGGECLRRRGAERLGRVLVDGRG